MIFGKPLKRVEVAYDGLRSYQIQDVLEAERVAVGIWYDPRLGKSRTAVRTIIRWIREGGFKKHVIIGPLTALEITWQNELEKAGFGIVGRDNSQWGKGEGAVFPLLRPPAGQSKGIWASGVIHRMIHADLMVPSIVLVNDDLLHKSFKTGPRGGAYNLGDLIIKWEPDSITLDEAHRIKNPGSKRSEALRRMGRHTRFRRALTGTPNPNGAKDIFGQFVFLDPEVFGTNFSDFRIKYFHFNAVTGKVEGWRSPELEAEFQKKVASRVHIVRATDQFPDLPPVIEIKRHIDLPENLQGPYDQLEDVGVIDNATENIFLECAHVLPQFTRMQQLAAGYLPKFTTSPDQVPLEGVDWKHDEKLTSIISDLEEPIEAGQKCVISYRWRPEGERIAAMLRKAYGESTVVELNGSTKNREEVVAPFNIDAPDTGSPVRIIVVQEATGGVGISLARADHLHFVTWSWDYAAVEQMRKRIWHPEKKRMTETFHIMSGTIDETIYRAIKDKHSVSFMVKTLGLHAMTKGAVGE